MRSCLLLALLWVLPFGLFSQRAFTDTSFMGSNKVVIEENGIFPLSKDSLDFILVDVQRNTLLCCYPDGVESFWYKIYVTVESRITFEIFPADPDNRYNYFLYQHKGELSMRAVYTTDIAPVRANLYKNKMRTGTGLSLSSQVSITDSCPRNIDDIFYRTPYHAAVIAKPGDVLLLNVYHLKGNDCGHHFILRSNGYSIEFQSIYQRCYSKQSVVKKTGHFTELSPLFDPVPAKADTAKGIYFVKDSLQNTRMEAEIICMKQGNGARSADHAEGRDIFEVILERNTAYTITFSALGYKSKTVSFFTNEEPLRSFKKEVRMALLSAGECFTMDKIYFYPNTYAIRPGSYSQVDQLAAYLRTHTEIKIEIQGHTNGNKRIRPSYEDEATAAAAAGGRFRGSARKLSEYRAETIKKYLIEKGVAADRLTAQGYGGQHMISPNPANQEEANRNIRVGVLLLSNAEDSPPVSDR